MKINFTCLQDNCDAIISFDLQTLLTKNNQVLCPSCYNPYVIDDNLKNKFSKLQNLIISIREAKDILGDCNIAVTVPGGEVKIPYTLLLTRLNTLVTLKLNSKNVDFSFQIESSQKEINFK